MISKRDMIYSSKDPWSELDDDKPKVEVHVKPDKCPAKDYHSPSFHKVETNITPDSEKYIPTYGLGSTEADLFANLEKEISIGSSSCLVVDCGFSLDVPTGFRIKIDSNINLKNKGVLANHFLDESCYNKKSDLHSGIRIKVSLINISKESITIYKDDKIATISIEPVYVFDWNN